VDGEISEGPPKSLDVLFMTTDDELLNLIEAGFSREAADALRTHKLTDVDREVMKNAVLETMAAFKPAAGTCVMMSVLLQLRLRHMTKTPAYVIVGTLKVNGQYVFGSASTSVDAKTFTQSNCDWDGHCWVRFGQYNLDLSLRRTALSGRVAPLLANHIRSLPGNGPIIGDDCAMKEDGLIYKPLRVLSDDELDPLINGALSKLGERHWDY
jgi:hypothetical protein